MPRSITVSGVLVALALWLAASYGVRYALMEDAQWVGLCSAPAELWQCQARAMLGLAIHFKIIAWIALACGVLAQVMAGTAGRVLAVLALVLGIPALVLYTASLAVFAVVLGGLRLVRGLS